MDGKENKQDEKPTEGGQFDDVDELGRRIRKEVEFQDYLKSAHKRSIHNREELEKSGVCGCFNCINTYPPQAIVEWIDDDDTALCPNCGIDSVLGDASGFPVTDGKFLSKMCVRYFGDGSVTVDDDVNVAPTHYVTYRKGVDF